MLCYRVAEDLIAFRFPGCSPFAWLDGVDVNRFAIESTRDGNIACCVAGSLALGLEFVDMAAHPETILRTLSYASVDASLIRGHTLCDLAVCAAMRIGDEALPYLLWLCALRVAHANVGNQDEDPQCQYCCYYFQVLCHRLRH